MGLHRRRRRTTLVGDITYLPTGRRLACTWPPSSTAAPDGGRLVGRRPHAHRARHRRPPWPPPRPRGGWPGRSSTATAAVKADSSGRRNTSDDGGVLRWRDDGRSAGSGQRIGRCVRRCVPGAAGAVAAVRAGVLAAIAAGRDQRGRGRAVGVSTPVGRAGSATLAGCHRSVWTSPPGVPVLRRA